MDKNQQAVQKGQEAGNEQVVYLVRLDGVQAWVNIRPIQRKKLGKKPARPQKEMLLKFYGWMQFEGQPQVEGRPRFSKLRSISMWSRSIRTLGGPLVLGGPVKADSFDPNEEGIIQELVLRTYYRALSRKEPACVEADATYPLVEAMQGSLTWGPGTQGGETVKLGINLRLAVSFLGRVGSVRFDPIELPLTILQPHMETLQQRHNSISTCTVGPQNLIGMQTEYTLKLRFISISHLVFDQNELNSIASTQLQGACRVWWQTGGLKLEPSQLAAAPGDVIIRDYIPDPAAPVGDPRRDPTGDIAGPDEINVPARVGETDADAIEVYLVDTLLGDVYPASPTEPTRNGAITQHCGCHNAFVLMEIDQARHNHYLLAHEIGHVLGLRHPDCVEGATGQANECSFIQQGSPCSVMVPDLPCPHHNTETNFGAVGVRLLGPTLTPSLPAATCGFYECGPRNYYPVIRDFPEDDGWTPSNPDRPPYNWWTDSDVWNSNQEPELDAAIRSEDLLYIDGMTKIFNDDYAPDFSLANEPTYSGPNNMCVRVRTYESVPGDYVKVHLFLAVPGCATDPLYLLTKDAAGTPEPLSFPLGNAPDRLVPGVSRVNFQPWDAFITDPVTGNTTGYPQDCCVFAVAYSDQDLTYDGFAENVVANPTLYHFGTLFGDLIASNNVAQRNLHIQGIRPLSLSLDPLRTTLPWFGIGNPTNLPGQFSLEVGFQSNCRLRNFEVELDNQIVCSMDPKEAIGRLSLPGEIKPGDFHTMRLKADLPDMMKEGDSLPIDIRMYIGDQLVSGYTYLIRAVSPGAATAQVIDGVVGALTVVGQAYSRPDAHAMLYTVKKLVQLARENPGDALRGLGDLVETFTYIGWELLNCADKEFQEAGNLMQCLAEMFKQAASGDDSPQLLEKIREYSDRLFEPASRHARMQYWGLEGGEGRSN
jgi:hypothetical protein